MGFDAPRGRARAQPAPSIGRPVGRPGGRTRQAVGWADRRSGGSMVGRSVCRADVRSPGSDGGVNVERSVQPLANLVGTMGPMLQVPHRTDWRSGRSSSTPSASAAQGKEGEKRPHEKGHTKGWSETHDLRSSQVCSVEGQPSLHTCG